MYKNGISRNCKFQEIEVYDHSEKNYNVKKELRIKTSMLRSD